MNAVAWFSQQSFNGRFADDSEPHKVIHIGTGNLVTKCNSRAEAESWLRQYGVSQEYNDTNYRIVPA